MKKILVVLNNDSGKLDANTHKKKIYKFLKKQNVHFKFIMIETLKHVENIEKYTIVAGVGGDGTINALLPYLINTNISLGFIPVGTANLLAAKLNIGTNIEKALKIILQGKTKSIDIGEINGSYFCLRLGFGFDGQVINKTRRHLKQKFGYFAYFLQGFYEMFKLKKELYKVTLDGETTIFNANMLVIVNNGNMYRNIVTLTPECSLNDGKFDIFLIRSKKISDFILTFLQIVFNRHKNNRRTIHKKASQICVESKCKEVHIDGEKWQKSEEHLNIQVLHKAIKVLVP